VWGDAGLLTGVMSTRDAFAVYLESGGGTLFLVACSKAYASSINRGSLHETPTNPTPKGAAGFASDPLRNGGFGAFGIIPNGTTMIG
jgi:hypothetical protein